MREKLEHKDSCLALFWRDIISDILPNYFGTGGSHLENVVMLRRIVDSMKVPGQRERVWEG